MKATEVRRPSQTLWKGGLGVALVWAAQASWPAAAWAQTATVKSSGEIADAIWKSKPGQVVRVPPGLYAALQLRNFKSSGVVTVTSADESHPAVFQGLAINDSQGLAFKHLEITVNTSNGYAVMLLHDNNVHFSELNLHGATVGDGNAMMVRNSSDVSLEKSEIHHFGTGPNHLNSDHVKFIDNNIHDMQFDGIRGGGTSNLTISGNHFTDFYPKAGDHPDAIQLWTRATTEPTHDVTITNNVFVRGHGDKIQGIFVWNEDKIPYKNVTITGNAIIGGMYHGISFSLGDNVVISGNLVQGFDDMNSWIMLKDATNATISDNQATTYQINDGNKNLIQKNNKQIRSAKVGDVSILRSWTKP